MIYLDNAATTPISNEGLVQLFKWNEQYGNSESSYSIGREASQVVEETRVTISKLIGAPEPKNVIFTSGGCEGNTTAIHSMVLELFSQHKKINIAISGLEHHSVINSVKWAEKYFKAKVHYYPLINGRIDFKKVKETKFFETKKINITSIIWGNNELGAIQTELIELIDEAKSYGVKVHIDAVQIIPHFGLTPLQRVINNGERVDYVTFSGHKIGAPKGIGVLYCADTEGLIPLINGGEQEFGKRGGTQNVGLIAALGVAVDKLSALDNKDVYFDYKPFINYINENLIIPENLSLNNPLILQDSDCYMGIINIDCKTENSPIVAYLDTKKICVSTGSACNGDGGYSHVLERLGLSPNTSIRVSLSPRTTQKEVEAFVKRTKEYLDLLKKISTKEN